MSWNARRFARNFTQSDGLMLWLSHDALARLEADGGHTDSVSEAVATILPVVAEHGRITIGLARQPDWRDGTDAESVSATAQLAVTVGDWNECLDLAGSMLDAWEGYEVPTHEQAVIRTLTRALLGGETMTAEGERVCLWFASEGDADAPYSVIKTVAAALRMFADPQARDDAACVHSTEQVQVMKPAKAKRAKVSPTRDVHVIDVRPRITSASGRDGTRNVEHDHRWVVRGHWRNQPCGPGRSLRRRIWIQSHVAGPDDKPVRREPTVYRIA